MNAHVITMSPEDGKDVFVHPASAESIGYVLSQDIDTGDGRSEWVWVRLGNGDLILGVFPQGDTYFAVEVDAEWPL